MKITGALALALCCVSAPPALAQAPRAGFPDVVAALRASPGVMGVETGQISSGKRVIFGWFESKKALVDWYHDEAHQQAMKRVFPDLAPTRQPLPDLPEDSGPILTIVSVKFADPTVSGAGGAAMPFASIGIELYTPLPGGVAVGGSFAPEAIASQVRGLRQIPIGPAQGPAR